MSVKLRLLAGYAVKMKKTVRNYFKYWIDYYGLNQEQSIKIMEKIDELFEIFDSMVNKKITSEWKSQRSPSNKND